MVAASVAEAEYHIHGLVDDSVAQAVDHILRSDWFLSNRNYGSYTKTWLMIQCAYQIHELVDASVAQAVDHN